MDRYALLGHPVAHSKSPLIHAAFARQTNQKLTYDRILVPLDGFIESVADFFAMGGLGCNVTLPFKEEAFQFANQLTDRAEQAGAVNTLWIDDDGVVGDNTDGIGLVRDLSRHVDLKDARVLLLGAGGAARGAIGPLQETGVAGITIANRSLDKAQLLAERFASTSHRVQAVTLDQPGEGFDLIINATSASIGSQHLPLPDTAFKQVHLAYDMMYAAEPTSFLKQCADAGVPQCVDGAGMLVEQAAESFWHWRGVRPDTAPVLADIRATLQQPL
ncbi:shikimate dehydrogenase [Burkholderiaceae bacterium DAT-1]|nr:shikimate dehydrogenase [Burkholderiaceae bacterium DAT-1]